MSSPLFRCRLVLLAILPALACFAADTATPPCAKKSAAPTTPRPKVAPTLPDTSDATRGLDLSRVALDLVYEADFSQPLRVIREVDLFENGRRVRRPEAADWVLEGSKATVSTVGGRLHLANGGSEFQ